MRNMPAPRGKAGRAPSATLSPIARWAVPHSIVLFIFISLPLTTFLCDVGTLSIHHVICRLVTSPSSHHRMAAEHAVRLCIPSYSSVEILAIKVLFYEEKNNKIVALRYNIRIQESSLANFLSVCVLPF